MIDLTSLLACPRCDSPLTGFRCTPCRVDFPVRERVPWLFAEPDSAMSEWHNRWQLALAILERDRKRAAVAQKDSSDTQALARLEQLVLGYAEQKKCLGRLLEPLAHHAGADLETHLALKTRPPTQQGLLTYAANMFRDWCWGEEENRLALEAVSSLLKKNGPEKILVLGAGAGRLAYDLHQSLDSAITVALDINPLLAYAANRIINGETVTMWEFPLAPRRAEDVAIERALSAPGPAREGFHYVLADALRAPFKTAQFDAVVTPWFVDIVEEAPAKLLPRINRLLETGGIWINHGSLAFGQANPADRLSLEELISLSTTCGFGEIESSETTVPYMNCPNSRHGRLEAVVTIKAVKQTDTPQPERHQALPDWIIDGRRPVPLTQSFQSQATVTRIHAFIMSLIDGKRTLTDMADVMEQQKLMQKQEATSAIRGFLIKMFEEEGGGRSY
ncbi:MAG: methyltransferase domain-containing protein [Gammaproteobacteria bacterium]|nr:methyltransferase domain-containing protein [Gammaproteobacteria bacterium]